MKYLSTFLIGTLLFILFTSALAQEPVVSTTKTPLVGVALTTTSTTSPLAPGVALTTTSTTTPLAGVALTTTSTTTPLAGVVPTTTSTTTPLAGIALTTSTTSLTQSTTSTTSSSSSSVPEYTTVFPKGEDGKEITTLFFQSFRSTTDPVTVPSGSIGMGTYSGSVGVTRAVNLFTVSTPGTTNSSEGREHLMLNNGIFVSLGVTLFLTFSSLIIY
ncbi:hypothetical protein NADFUDRAFT_64354 [Nadsonia fulvescens var. elongata DSM 6958]|uniref:Uncharacterized protein n=1 Tax=Nadsonia fulvescens var. elongata DSM 6958 TaxID=857566 RepID=A0A1E3PP42_9ASCO|nr:hypothetical protein NADFUDRAFT_64354 [Nadsonia fulvescens var. elongata DSM 6958]